MATILPFVIRPKASSTRLPVSDAAIVIFPGVRYEPSQVDRSDERRKAASTARKRKNKTN